MLDVYVDADGCPVKEEVCRVAQRYGLTVYVVSNRPLRVPLEEGIHPVVVGNAFDAADDWIAERVGVDDIVITADLLLADRCIRADGRVLSPRGQIYDENNIGSALATRELMDQLRQMGEVGGGPPPMAKRDRSQFLAVMDQMVNAVKRNQ